VAKENNPMIEITFLIVGNEPLLCYWYIIRHNYNSLTNKTCCHYRWRWW